MQTAVAVVEDNEEVLERFVSILQSEPDMRLAGTAGTVAEGLALVERQQADVFLVDLGLPDGSGIAVIEHALRHRPGCEVMVITVFGDEHHVVTSIEAGATGYLLKDDAPADIATAIRTLREGGTAITPVIARKLLQRFQAPRPQPLESARITERENTILGSLAKGMSYKEIAALHGIAINTVARHVKNIYAKLTVHSRGEAIFEATRRGILTL